MAGPTARGRAAAPVEGRRRTPAILRYLAFDHNRRELEEARALARELEVDYLNVRPAATPEEYEMIRSSVAAHDGAAPNGAVDNHCYWLWSVPTVQHDGDVKPCCLLTLNPPDQGNAFKDGGLSAVWAGERFRQFRHQMLTDKSHIPSCRNCPSFPGMQDRPLKTILSRFRQDPERTAR